MSDTGTIWLILCCSACALAVAHVVTGRRSVVVFVAAYFAYFAFGPVLNHLLGNQISARTITWQIKDACVLFALALTGLLAVAVIYRQRPKAPQVDRIGSREYPFVQVLLWAFTAFIALVLMLRGPELIGRTKTDKIAAMGGFHYSLLIVEFMLLSLYYVIKDRNAIRRAYWINAAAYLLYCLATSERDFLFIGFSLLIYRVAIYGGHMNLKAVAAVIFGVFVATWLFAYRSGDQQVSSEAVLNQGSLLLVDTNVLAIVPEQMPFYEGRTYLNGVANLLPSRLYHTQLNLSEWLVDWIAPGSPGGYGFSLSAEAYMNFGRPGVLGFFMLTAFIQIWLVNRFRMSDFYAFFSVFYTGIWMYSLRNDSFTMIKSCTYAIAFYGLAQALSNPAWRFERLFAPKSRAAAAHALRRGQRVLQSS